MANSILSFQLEGLVLRHLLRVIDWTALNRGPPTFPCSSLHSEPKGTGRFDSLKPVALGLNLSSDPVQKPQVTRYSFHLGSRKMAGVHLCFAVLSCLYNYSTMVFSCGGNDCGSIPSPTRLRPRALSFSSFIYFGSFPLTQPRRVKITGNETTRQTDLMRMTWPLTGNAGHNITYTSLFAWCYKLRTMKESHLFSFSNYA